jgi:hypothetical protein
MGRPKNAAPTTRVAPTITIQIQEQLEYLAELGMFGSNPSDVARYLITRALEELIRSNILPPPTKKH